MDFMKNKLGLISGIALMIFGIFMISLGLREMDDKMGRVFFLIYGGISMILGLYMLFNLEKEDSIEQIKNKSEVKK